MDTKILDHSDNIKETWVEPFPGRLQTLYQQVDQVQHTDQLKKIITGEFAEFSGYFISQGDSAWKLLVEDRALALDHLEPIWMHYRLSEQFKSVLILHRDVLLQLHIADNQRLEGQVDHEQLERHFKACKHLLLEALTTMGEFQKQELLSLSREKNKESFLATIKHQKNPWEVYKRQFELLLEQFSEIEKSSAVLSRMVEVYGDIRAYILTLTSNVSEDFKQSREIVASAVSKLEKLKEVKELTGVVQWLDQIIDERPSSGNHEMNFANAIEQMTKNLESIDLPISTQDGILVKRKVETEKVTGKWLEFILLPLLFEVWDTRQAMESFLDHSLVNLRSGLAIAKNDGSLEPVNALIQSLKSIDHTLNENIDKQKEAESRIESLVTKSMMATNLYHREDFLEVSLQSSILQYTSVKNPLLNRLKEKLVQWFSKIGSKYEEASLSSSQKRMEAAIECINYRMFKEANSSYDALFRSKIFIGDLFLVPRAEQERTLMRSLKLWNAGFNQSALIVGKHLSGKTTFLEYVAKKHFGKHVIKLSVNDTVVVEGRKFQTGFNLKEALRFTKNNLYHSNPLIIIDNLELWRDDQHHLLDNVRAVVKYIESESDNAYVMVATSDAMRDHLDSRIPFTHAFSTIINLNRSSLDEIHQALLLRHGASNKQLITEGEQNLTAKNIEQEIKDLSREVNYNIGEVLQAWTYRTTVIDDRQVLYQVEDYPFADFFTPEETIVLKFIVLYQHINEVVLKEFLGSDNRNYLSGLKRLINTKVLLRSDNGELHLNTVVHHDVLDILKYRGIL